MELSKKDINMTKGVAILFMLLLHLFCRKDINGLYETFIIINDVPLLYYLALFGDACVPMYCFASGYGLYISFNKINNSNKKNVIRILKLLLNFWIIFIIFITIGTFTGTDKYPGSLTELLLNFLMLSNSYNGAWWFLQTYIILVFISPSLFKIIKKYNSILVLLVSCVIYLLSFFQRIKDVFDLGDNTFLLIIINAIVLVGTSLFPFTVGTIFAKDKVFTRFSKEMNKLSLKNTACVIGILLLIIIHSIYESMVIAPITGIAFICIFNVMNKKSNVQKALNYFGRHSTNVWLTHMFFYMIIFPEMTFAPRYPIFIFMWLITLCLLSSYVVNYIYNHLIIIIDKRLVVKGKSAGMAG